NDEAVLPVPVAVAHHVRGDGEEDNALGELLWATRVWHGEGRLEEHRPEVVLRQAEPADDVPGRVPGELFQSLKVDVGPRVGDQAIFEDAAGAVQKVLDQGSAGEDRVQVAAPFGIEAEPTTRRVACAEEHEALANLSVAEGRLGLN